MFCPWLYLPDLNMYNVGVPLNSLTSYIYINANIYLKYENVGSAFRSSHPEMFCKKGVLKNFSKSQEKAPVTKSLL